MLNFSDGSVDVPIEGERVDQRIGFPNAELLDDHEQWTVALWRSVATDTGIISSAACAVKCTLPRQARCIRQRSMAFGRGSFNTRKRKKRGSSLDPVTVTVGAGFVVMFFVVVGLFLHLVSAPSDAGMVSEIPLSDTEAGEILVPIETVQVGASFQPTMFRRELRPEEQITGDMVRSYDELKGFYAKGVLIKNQPILRGALTNRQPVHILTAMIPKNFRAVALQVEKPMLDNVDGWAQPGTDVDVVWVTKVFGRELAAILAGPVRVLAANKATEWTAAKGPASDKLVTVTLLLSTRDALRVNLAAMHGKVTLGLRGLADKRPNEAIRPTSNLTDEPAPQPVAKPIVSVTVRDPKSRESEVRTYDVSGRRVP
jgi:Flp pilus assembly protein CpaB